MNFTEEQIERYSRHIILKNVGGGGQEKMLNARILIIGAGGLGAPAALYLAAAGIGTIGIADGDTVELSNLQRQVIHFTPDLNRLKVDSSRDKIEKINPDVTVKTYPTRVLADNVRDILSEYDFVIDGTDNFPAKFLINDACVMAQKPYSHGGILRFFGQTLTYTPGTLCYRCIFEDLPPKGAVPSCSEAGILGVMAGILGTIQAAEAIKYILGIGTLLTNTLLTVDTLDMNFRNVALKKNANCPVCGDNPSITELHDYEQPVCELKR